MCCQYVVACIKYRQGDELLVYKVYAIALLR